MEKGSWVGMDGVIGFHWDGTGVATQGVGGSSGMQATCLCVCVLTHVGLWSEPMCFILATLFFLHHRFYFLLTFIFTLCVCYTFSTSTCFSVSTFLYFIFTSLLYLLFLLHYFFLLASCVCFYYFVHFTISISFFTFSILFLYI